MVKFTNRDLEILQLAEVYFGQLVESNHKKSLELKLQACDDRIISVDETGLDISHKCIYLGYYHDGFFINSRAIIVILEDILGWFSSGFKTMLNMEKFATEKELIDQFIYLIDYLHKYTFVRFITEQNHTIYALVDLKYEKPNRDDVLAFIEEVRDI